MKFKEKTFFSLKAEKLQHASKRIICSNVHLVCPGNKNLMNYLFILLNGNCTVSVKSICILSDKKNNAESVNTILTNT